MRAKPYPRRNQRTPDSVAIYNGPSNPHPAPGARGTTPLAGILAYAGHSFLVQGPDGRGTLLRIVQALRADPTGQAQRVRGSPCSPVEAKGKQWVARVNPGNQVDTRVTLGYTDYPHRVTIMLHPTHSGHFVRAYWRMLAQGITLTVPA